MAELARLKRKVRRLEQSRRRWKQRVADKQAQIRRLRVNVRDLTLSRQLWKQRCLDRPLPAGNDPAAAVLPTPLCGQEPSVGEP
jgi:hypothetical protein